MSAYNLSQDYDSETLWRLRLEEAAAYEMDWQRAESEHNTKGTNMKVSEAFPSKYLKAADLNGKAYLVKLTEVTQEEVGPSKDLKLVAYFAKGNKGMILNQTNSRVIASKYGDDTDGWFGAELELYPDRVSFNNQMVDALRVRLPVPKAVEGEDEIPF